MSAIHYLENLPRNWMVRRAGNSPREGIPFTGYPRQHPSEKDKVILVYEPLGQNLAVLEFMLEDVLFVEEVLQAVTESGEGLPLVKLWIRRGARGVLMEPFEVDEPPRFAGEAREFRERFMGNRSASGEWR
jgi:hypothetical protein